MEPLELYIHIPFCKRKCFYCDFLSGPVPREEQEQYMKALLEEIRLFSRTQEARREVSTVFFGGGTPSVAEPVWIEKLLEEIREGFEVEKEAEITMEVNPGTVTPDKLACYRRGGINRLSIGLQSADNKELFLLGRIHTWEMFLESYRDARKAGFSNINIDLISGIPGQTKKSWETTLKRVCRLEPEHISAYSLILEPGTPFYEKYKGTRPVPSGEGLPSEEEERAMYGFTGDFLKKKGYDRYEISNYARPQKQCRHNNGYWTGTLYKGFGIGAASYLFLDGAYWRTANIRDRRQYVRLFSGEAPPSPGKLLEEKERVTEKNRMEEFFFLGLRRMEGVSEGEFYSRFGRWPDEVYKKALDKLVRQKLIQRENGRIFLTPFGIDVSNQVFVEFLL